MIFGALISVFFNFLCHEFKFVDNSDFVFTPSTVTPDIAVDDSADDRMNLLQMANYLFIYF